jgi:glucose/arabinose dehydrogenase
VAIVCALLPASPAQAAQALPNGFFLNELTNVLNQPVGFGFTPAGRLYVAEKGGTVQVFDSVDDPTPTEVINVSGNVHDYWDRGLLGFAVDPGFGSGSDYVYLLYTYDPGNSWGDDCAFATSTGCLVNGRLSRFQIQANGTAGSEIEILSGKWCAQFPSHTVGDLAFSEEGHLLVSAGDGASFNFADHGQNGNPCGDPMGVAGAADNMGGALRSQRPADHPEVTYDGTVLRVNKATGTAIAGNPGGVDPRIIAQGLRNPFRMTVRPGTSEIWLGDVGWGAWEEVNRIVDPGGSRENFGWPCYEGTNTASAVQPAYESLDLDLCETLYAAGESAVIAPHYARPHQAANTHPGCAGTGGAVSGLAFYEGGNYPSQYDGALFIADYSIGCIRVMFPSAPFGVPDKNTISSFVGDAAPVDLQIGPEGDLFYADIASGRIVRVSYNNAGPTAVAGATPTTGGVPLQVQFDGTGSTDPEGDTVTYEWDLDGDGLYDDSTFVSPSRTYTAAGEVTVGLRVWDPFGNSSSDTVVVNPVANQGPTAHITSPASSLTWRVGDTISFSGNGSDPEVGALPPSALVWQIVMNHCEEAGFCHEHVIHTIPGVTSGNFTAPDHPYPSYLSIRLTATDPGGLTDVDSIDVQPKTTVITLESAPNGLSIEAGVEGLESFPAPHSIIAIEGGILSVNARNQSLAGVAYNFVGWSNGQAQSHTIEVPVVDLTLQATYAAVPGGGGGGGGGAGGGGAPANDGFDDVPDSHPFYRQIQWMETERITVGCAENLFCPDSPVTRGQMASFLVRAFGLPPAESVTFTDISESVHQADIMALLARGITVGCANERFCPQDPVTRAQMASFLVRTLILSPGPDRFTDDNDSPHEGDINALAASGVTQGCRPLEYCPEAWVTRAEMAVFLFRSFNPTR